MAGDKPSMISTSGLSIIDKNCLAYEERDSIYLLCPSAKIVSNANEDFPEPDNPVIVISLSLGISKLIFLRLCVFAPLTKIFFFIVEK
jgi:hypothetical protein